MHVQHDLNAAMMPAAFNWLCDCFRMKFQSNERTLKDEEVDIVINKIVDKLKNKFNAIQR